MENKSNESLSGWVSTFALILNLGMIPASAENLPDKDKSVIVDSVPSKDIKLLDFFSKWNLNPKGDPMSGLKKFTLSNPEFGDSKSIYRKYIKEIKGECFVIKSLGVVYKLDIPINKKLGLTIDRDPDWNLGLSYTFENIKSFKNFSHGS
jgi:hypothetical protein